MHKAAVKMDLEYCCVKSREYERWADLQLCLESGLGIGMTCFIAVVGNPPSSEGCLCLIRLLIG